MTDTSILHIKMFRILFAVSFFVARTAAASSPVDHSSSRGGGLYLRVRKQPIAQKGQAGERILKKDEIPLKEQDITHPPTTTPPSSFPTMPSTTLTPTAAFTTEVPTAETSAEPTASSMDSMTSPPSSTSPVDMTTSPPPTANGPVTRSPTGIPTDVPTTALATTLTEIPTAGSTSASPVAIAATHSPTLTPKFEANEEKATSDEDHISRTTAVSLMPFRLDLVTTLSNSRRLRSSNLRRLNYQDNAFTRDQDISLLSILSFHLLMQFQQNLVGDPLMVELNIDEKSNEKQFDGLEAYYEEEATKKKASNDTEAGLDVEERSNAANVVEEQPALVMISYTFSGSIVYAGDATAATMTLPSSLELETETLRAFRSESGKQSLMKAFGRSEDHVLRGIADVDVTRDDAGDGGKSLVESLWNDPNFPMDYNGGEGDFASNPNELQESNGAIGNTNNNSDDQGQSGQMNVYFIALIGLAFGSTFVLIAFLGYRKYKQHRHQPYRKSTTKPKKGTNTKRKNLKIDTSDSKKLRQYKPMESPESSFITSSESPVGADTYPTSSRDESDLFTASGSGSPTNHPIDGDSDAAQNNESVPLDEASYDMPYLSQVSKATGFHSTFLSNTESRDETLDGLYSDKDSYFESSVVSSSHNRQYSFQGRHRSESKDSMDTYGHDLSYDFDEVGEAAPHIVEGIREVIEGHGGDAPFQFDHNISPDNNVIVPSSSPRDTLQTLNTSIDQPILERSNEDHDDEESPQKPELSVTENLFERISGLEHMIQNSENKLTEEEQREAIQSSSANDMVMNDNQKDESPSKNAREFETDKMYNTDTPSASSQICSGIFTKETLGEINRSRLNSTPPPSEGDYDEEISNVASVTSLLGNLDDSDEEAEAEDEQMWMFER